MLQPAVALQWRLARLSSGVDHRRRTRAADRDRSSRQHRVGLFGSDLYCDLRGRQHHRHAPPARLHQSGHLAGGSLRGARREPRSSRSASRQLIIRGYGEALHALAQFRRIAAPGVETCRRRNRPATAISTRAALASNSCKVRNGGISRPTGFARFRQLGAGRGHSRMGMRPSGATPK